VQSHGQGKQIATKSYVEGGNTASNKIVGQERTEKWICKDKGGPWRTIPTKKRNSRGLFKQTTRKERGEKFVEGET